MTQPPEPADSQSWHKRFAVSCNNRAWALSTQLRTPQQDREMLDAAHASAWHWAQIGTELNRMRATMLLAEVHALLGNGPSSFSFAQEMRSYFLGRDSPDWEVAFVHAIYAHAAYATGRFEAHRAAYDQAAAALEAVVDEEDRKIVSKTFAQVPAP